MFTVIVNTYGVVVILLTSKIRSIVMKEILDMEGLVVIYTDDKEQAVNGVPEEDIRDFSDGSENDWYYTSNELKAMDLAEMDLPTNDIDYRALGFEDYEDMIYNRGQY